MKSRLRNALVGVTALGMVAVGYVGGKEGLKLVAYPDIIGVWTGCYGETKGMHKGMRFTKGQCDSMLVDSLVDHETGMRKCLKDPDAIPDKSYLAFLSGTYNIGVGAFCRSSMARRANIGDLRGACNALMLYVNAGAKKNVRGLVLRSTDEKKLCLEGLKS
jgi:lysozyme